MPIDPSDLSDAMHSTVISDAVSAIRLKQGQPSADAHLRVATKIVHYISISHVRYSEALTLLCFFKSADSLKSFSQRKKTIPDVTLSLLESAVDKLLTPMLDAPISTYYPENIGD